MKVNVKNPGVPVGHYHAKYLGGEMLKSIKMINGEAYQMTFEIIGGDYDGKKTTRLVNPQTLSAKGNMVKFFAQLAGVEPVDGLDLDDLDYVGVRYELRVAEKDESDWTQFDKIGRRLGDDEKPIPETDEVPF